MNVKIYPQSLSGTVIIPGSKSLTHRALICASLANGISTIINPLLADDTFATIKCLKALGVKIIISEHEIKVFGVKRYTLQGKLEANESASTLRFLIPLISLWHDAFTIYASPRLLKRIDTNDLNTLKGLKFTINKDNLEVKGKLEGNLYLSDEITTQWISGLLFTLPFTKGSLSVNKLDNKYIDLTITMMLAFKAFIINNHNLLTSDGSFYQSQTLNIEGDFSNASFFLTSAIFNDIKVQGLNLNSIQGDRNFLTHLMQMGLKWTYHDSIIIQNKRPEAINLDLSLNPDLAPIMAALASVSKGRSIISGLNKLKYKESDRLQAIYESLKALGAKITIANDALIIEGQEYLPGGAIINGFNDHRIVMSLIAISSQVKESFVITDAEAVNKSFPEFFTLFKQLGGKYEYQI